MKLQKLTIRNITSIEEAVIDFEQEPLSNESIFLICGETGSGKTTILDAICLALYNDTPRMNQSVKENYRDVHHQFSSKDEVSISDIRQLMRRNTAEAWVELEFIGSNDIPYKAQWYVRCARKKANHTIQSVTWSWENRRTQQTLAKKADILQEQKSAIGLSFEQFCRTTLLAQGDFTKFLQSRSKDKSEILEKLTGTDIYSRLGEKIFTLTKEKKQAYDLQVQKLEGILLLTNEEQEELHKSIDQLKETAKQAKDERDRVQQKMNWLRTNDELQEKLTQQESDWRKQQEELTREEFLTAARLIQDWTDSTEARNCYEQLQEKSLQQKAAQKEEMNLQQRLRSLLAGDKWFHQQQEELKERLRQTEQCLEETAPYAPMLEESASILTLLRTACEANNQLQKKQREEKELEATVIRQEERRDEEKKAVNEWKQSVEKKGEELAKLNKYLESLKPDEVQQQLVEIEQQTNRCHKTLGNLNLLLEQHKNLLQAKEELEAIQQKLNQLAQQHPALKQTYEELMKQENELDTTCKKQKEAVEDWPKEVRLHLHIGDTCPVCGKIIETELPTDKYFQSILQPTQELWKQKKEELKKAEDAWRTNETEIKSKKEEYQSKRKATEQRGNAYQEAYRHMLASCSCYQFDQLTTSEKLQLEKLLEKLKNEQKELREQEKTIQAVHKEIKNAQTEKDKLQKHWEAANQQLKVQEENLSNALSEVKVCRTTMQEKGQLIKETLEKLRPMMLWKDWEMLWENNPQHLIEKLSRVSRDYQQQKEEKSELMQKLEKGKDQEDVLTRSRDSVHACFPNWPMPEAQTPCQTDNLPNAWHQFEKSVQHLLSRQQEIGNTLSQLQESLSRFVQDHPQLPMERIQETASYKPDDIEKLRKVQQQTKEKVIALKTAFQQTKKNWEEHQRRQPELQEADTLEQLTASLEERDAQCNTVNRKIGQQESRLRQNLENQERMKGEKEEADRLKEIYEQWERLNYYFGDATGTKFRNIAQSFVLKELLHGANHYLHCLTDRYELECQAGSLTILLRDYYQGGNARPTTTLSGGESFLISLSLALGLSSLNQESLSTDMLFIDEGFGTLSEDYLNTVMDTLERLHQLGGKKVGIISHVEGLRERIKTQIQVNRKDHSRSEINVVRTL